MPHSTQRVILKHDMELPAAKSLSQALALALEDVK